MIYGLTPDQEKKFKIKQAASRIEQAPRKWVYNNLKQGVLVNTEAEFDEIKSIFNLDKPGCDNREVIVLKFGEAKKQINKAKRDLAAKKEADAKIEAEKVAKELAKKEADAKKAKK